MNFKSCFVLSVTGLIFSVTVNAAPISNLSVTGGTFGGDFSGAFPFIGGPHAFANVGAYNLVTDTTTVDWDISTPQSTPSTSALASFIGAATWAQLFMTGPSSGTVNGFSTGISNGDAIVFDMSSLDLNWNGNTFNVGGLAAGTVTNVSSNVFDYNVSWTGIVSSGAFVGEVYNLTFTGTGSVVPVPAAIWLFSSGLLGLLAVARSRQ